MVRDLKIFALAALMLAAVPCAALADDGATYGMLHAKEPAIEAGKGRIYFYRRSALTGVGVQPTILIDGASTGARAKTGGYFYVDVPAGTHEISVPKLKTPVSPAVAAGQSVYVRFDVGSGFSAFGGAAAMFAAHVQPVIVLPDAAEAEIAECKFVAPTPSADPAAADAPAPTSP